MLVPCMVNHTNEPHMFGITVNHQLLRIPGLAPGHCLRLQFHLASPPWVSPKEGAPPIQVSNRTWFFLVVKQFWEWYLLHVVAIDILWYSHCLIKTQAAQNPNLVTATVVSSTASLPHVSETPGKQNVAIPSLRQCWPISGVRLACA